MPRPVAVYSHDLCLAHDTGGHHPECPQRITAIRQALEAAPFASLLHFHTAAPAPTRWIERIHSREYRSFVEEACLKGLSTVDMGETRICEDSYNAALLAAGAAIGSVDAVLRDGYSCAFSLARPPGHHASEEKAEGFCIFNNIAIAAHYAECVYGMERICILDWDVHHGNGTQRLFYASPSILFCSLHQLPLYPHSGEFHETGTGAGQGYTINCPFPHGATIDQYRDALQGECLPAIRQFKPQMILLSAGFDAHADDPLADIQLTSDDYLTLTRWARQIAQTFTQGRLVSILEGGYHLPALAQSTTAHLKGLVEDPPSTLINPNPYSTNTFPS